MDIEQSEGLKRQETVNLARDLLSIALFIPLEDLGTFCEKNRSTWLSNSYDLSKTPVADLCKWSGGELSVTEYKEASPNGRVLVRRFLKQFPRSETLMGSASTFKKRIHALLPKGTVVSLGLLCKLYEAAGWNPHSVEKFQGQVKNEHDKCCALEKTQDGKTVLRVSIDNKPPNWRPGKKGPDPFAKHELRIKTEPGPLLQSPLVPSPVPETAYSRARGNGSASSHGSLFGVVERQPPSATAPSHRSSIGVIERPSPPPRSLPSKPPIRPHSRDTSRDRPQDRSDNFPRVNQPPMPGRPRTPPREDYVSTYVPPVVQKSATGSNVMPLGNRRVFGRPVQQQEEERRSRTPLVALVSSEVVPEPLPRQVPAPTGWQQNEERRTMVNLEVDSMSIDSRGVSVPVVTATLVPPPPIQPQPHPPPQTFQPPPTPPKPTSQPVIIIKSEPEDDPAVWIEKPRRRSASPYSPRGRKRNRDYDYRSDSRARSRSYSRSYSRRKGSRSRHRRDRDRKERDRDSSDSEPHRKRHKKEKEKKERKHGKDKEKDREKEKEKSSKRRDKHSSSLDKQRDRDRGRDLDRQSTPQDDVTPLGYKYQRTVVEPPPRMCAADWFDEFQDGGVLAPWEDLDADL